MSVSASSSSTIGMEYDPAPIKSILKTAVHPCTKVAIEASGKCIKDSTGESCSIPGPVKEWALEACAQETTQRANKAIDNSIDSSFRAPESLGSRIVVYLKSWG